MPARKKPIRVSAHDDGVLRALYLITRIPRDQFKKRPRELAEFARTFNRLTGRNDSGEDLVHYISTKQKAKRRLKEPWPTFDGNHRRAPSLTETFTDRELLALREAYKKVVLPHGLGVDAVLWNEPILTALAAEFTRLTGRIVPGLYLLAIAEERRKRKDWDRVGRDSYGSDFNDPEVDMGFDDLDAAGSL